MALYPRGYDPWNYPFSTLKRLQDEVNRAFGDFRLAETGEFPPVNLWRNADGVIVTAEVPGVRLADMEITVHQNTLTIKGKREPEADEPKATFHRQERQYGSFARTISLPFNVDSEHVHAGASNGVLTIQLPRPEAEKPKRIHIRAG
jgi:HSP20 family protein